VVKRHNAGTLLKPKELTQRRKGAKQAIELIWKNLASLRLCVKYFLFLAFLLPGCAPRRPDPAPEGDRIVSLAPNLTEIVCAIGAGSALVGRTSVCDYPPEIVKSVPVIGGFGAPSMDRLLKTRPTLILDVALEDETVANLMTQLGIRRVRVPCAMLDDIPTAILTVGRLAHRESAAQPLAERIRRAVSERRDALARNNQVFQHSARCPSSVPDSPGGRDRPSPAGTPPTVFVEIWGDPLMTVGRKSFVSELVTLAGGRNLGDEVTDKDYFPVSSEWVIARNPDIILCLSVSGQMSEVSNQQLEIGNQKSEIGNQIATRTGWAQIKAVRDGRVYGGFDNNLILRPGPRVLEGIEALQACIQKSEGKSQKNP
jgi:iron complex transport system substrate-binding protein